MQIFSFPVIGGIIGYLLEKTLDGALWGVVAGFGVGICFLLIFLAFGVFAAFMDDH